MSVIPGTHWFARLEDPNTGEERLSPLIAWVVDEITGHVRALITDPASNSRVVTEAGNRHDFRGFSYVPPTAWETNLLSRPLLQEEPEEPADTVGEAGGGNDYR